MSAALLSVQVQTMCDLMARDAWRRRDCGIVPWYLGAGVAVEGERTQLALGTASCQPIAFDVPFDYDDAGVDFDPATDIAVSTTMATPSVTTLANGVESSFQSCDKNLPEQSFHVLGMDSAASLTVEIRRTAAWDTTGATTVTVWSHTFSGADGTNQFIYAPHQAAPAAKRAQASYTWKATWTGTIGLVQAARTDLLLKVVPRAPGGDWTIRKDLDLDGGDYGVVPVAWPSAHAYRHTIGGQCNWRFARQLGSSVTTTFIPTRASPLSRYGRCLGRAEDLHDWTFRQPTGTPVDYLDVAPIGLVDGVFQRHEFGGVCNGFNVGFVNALNGNNGALLGASNSTPTVSTSKNLGKWPGLRNARAFFANRITVGSWSTVSITIRLELDGVVIGSHTITSVPTDDDGTYVDFGAALPASWTMLAEAIAYLTITATGSGSWSFQCQYNVKCSPRCDIPLFFTSSGPGGVAPGGYLPSKLADPAAWGTVTHDASVPVSHAFVASVDHPLYHVLSFVPPTTGIRKVTGVGNVIGEYLFGNQVRSSAICRAGKRAYAVFAQTKAAGTQTMTFTTVARVNNAVPSGAGLTVTSGLLTDSNWLFGTIAIPAAGRYRIRVTARGTSAAGDFGTSLYLAYSASDQYCADPDAEGIDDPMGLGSVTALQSTPPGSPSAGLQYLVTATATGAWAGHEGEIAYWSSTMLAWRFRRLRAPRRTRLHEGYRYGFVVGSVYHWRDRDGQWYTESDPRIELTVDVAAAQDVYVRLGLYDPMRQNTTDAVTARNSAIVISWAAV